MKKTEIGRAITGRFVYGLFGAVVMTGVMAREYFIPAMNELMEEVEKVGVTLEMLQDMCAPLMFAESGPVTLYSNDSGRPYKERD